MRSVSRDTSGVRTAAETPRDLAASTNYDPIGLGPLQTAAARIKTTGIQQTPSDTQMSKSDNWKAHGPSLDQNTPDAHVPEEAVAQAHVHVEIPPIPPATLQTDAGNGQTRASARHQRNASNTSTYDVDDLDSDWQNLLDNVDALLVRDGRPAMLPQERPVAVRKLVAATGTRGVEYALGAAVAEIVKFRSWNVAAHRPAH